MKVRCRTNIDDFKREIWPTELCCRPLKGDKVQSKNGRVLSIVDITHASVQTWDTGSQTQGIRSILIVELHQSYPSLGSPPLL